MPRRATQLACPFVGAAGAAQGPHSSRSPQPFTWSPQLPGSSAQVRKSGSQEEQTSPSHGMSRHTTPAPQSPHSWRPEHGSWSVPHQPAGRSAQVNGVHGGRASGGGAGGVGMGGAAGGGPGGAGTGGCCGAPPPGGVLRSVHPLASPIAQRSAHAVREEVIRRTLATSHRPRQRPPRSPGDPAPRHPRRAGRRVRAAATSARARSASSAARGSPLRAAARRNGAARARSRGAPMRPHQYAWPTR
jgi:hypothetical protein